MSDKNRKNPLGPTGEHVRANVERIRKARALSYQALSDKLGDLERPIPPLGLSRIERGERRVDADDLVALAVALRVNPTALLLPPVADRSPVEITAAGLIEARTAWDWADGKVPIDYFTILRKEGSGAVEEAMVDFQMHARPRSVRIYGGWEIPDDGSDEDGS